MTFVTSSISPYSKNFRQREIKYLNNKKRKKRVIWKQTENPSVEKNPGELLELLRY